MDKLSEYWYLIVLLLLALVLSPTVMLKIMAACTDDLGHTNEFRMFFESLPPFSRALFLGIRLVPFAGLGLVLVILSKTHLREYLYPLLIGGAGGMAAVIAGAFWAMLTSYGTDAQAFSTVSRSLMFIPFFGVPAGAIGAIFAGAIYAAFRYLLKKD